MDLGSWDVIGVAAAVVAAQETRLLSALATAPGSATEMAARLGLDPRATERVLAVLVGVGLAARAGDRFEASGALLSMEQGAGGLEGQAQLWGHASRFLRTGESWVVMDGDAHARGSVYRDTVAGLGRMFEEAARVLAARLEQAPARILDVGCGSGVWSLAIAERFTGAQVIGLDLPAVVPAFEARAAALGLADRVSTIAADAHSYAPDPGAFDLVLVANLLHLETAERAESLVRRAAAAVAVGGELVIVDALCASTPDAQRSLAVYALHLAMRTRVGHVPSAEEVRAWLEGAGLASVSRIELGERAGAVGAMRARRVA